jgi:hypothetical protein
VVSPIYQVITGSALVEDPQIRAGERAGCFVSDIDLRLLSVGEIRSRQALFFVQRFGDIRVPKWQHAFVPRVEFLVVLQDQIHEFASVDQT